MVDLARADYEAPDTDVICQAIAQRTIIYDFLITNRPFVTPPPHTNQISYQDSEITMEEQQLASVNIFGNSITFITKRSTQAVPHYDHFQ